MSYYCRYQQYEKEEDEWSYFSGLWREYNACSIPMCVRVCACFLLL